MDAPPTRTLHADQAADAQATRRDVAIVAMLAASLLLSQLDAIDLWAPDEPRYAQVADEVGRSRTGGPLDLVLLRLNGEVYTQKPPLYFWLAAIAGSSGDRVDEVAARLPSALSGVAVAILTAVFGRLLSGRWTTGLLAALVLLTLPRFAHHARRAQLDVLLTLFELVALIAYWRIDSSPQRAGPPATRWLFALHGAVALALLTKGPVGALPWLVILVHRAITGRLSSVRALFPIWGVALALAPALAWAGAAIALAAPGYWHEAIVDNLITRFFLGTDHARPFYYFAVQLPVDVLPWTPVMILAAVALWRERPRSKADSRMAALLLAWTLVFVIFFSLSAGKRGLYLLPLFPGLAVLAALPLTRWLDAGRVPLAFTLCAVGVLTTVSAFGVWSGLGAPGSDLAEAIPDWPRSAAWSVAFVGLAGALAVGCGHRSRYSAALGIAACLASMMLLESILFRQIYPAIDPQKSPRPIAQLVHRVTAPAERVGVFRHSAFAGGLEYYAQRRVVVLESARDVEQFRDSGARIVVVRESDLDALTSAVPHRVVGAGRNGRRRLLVIEVLAPASLAHPSTL